MKKIFLALTTTLLATSAFGKTLELTSKYAGESCQMIVTETIDTETALQTRDWTVTTNTGNTFELKSVYNQWPSGLYHTVDTLFELNSNNGTMVWSENRILVVSAKVGAATQTIKIEFDNHRAETNVVLKANNKTLHDCGIMKPVK